MMMMTNNHHHHNDTHYYTGTTAAAATTSPHTTTINNCCCCCWSCCCCGMATDAVQIIDRLLLPSNMDYCEYDGPCSVEGLAGHADYPYPCIKPTPAQQQAMTERKRTLQQNGRLSKDEISELLKFNSTDCNHEENIADLSDSILAHLQGYETGLRALRIPTDISKQKIKKVQDTLAPVLHSSDSGVAKMLTESLGKPSEKSQSPRPNTEQTKILKDPTTRRQLRSRRRVTWEEIDSASSASNLTTDKKENGNLPVPSSVVQQDTSYELVLPNELPETLQQGIQTALEHIFDRDQPIFLPSNVDESVAAVCNKSREQEEKHDDMSSIGIGGVSMAPSTVAGHGGIALRHLLARVGRSNTKIDDGASAGRKVSRLESDFLLMENDDDADADDSNGNNVMGGADSDSDLSTSDIEDDAVSLVGQKALAALLSNVKQRSAKTNTNRTATIQRRQDGLHSQQQPTEPSEFREEEQSCASSQTGHGKKALKNLLGLVKTNASLHGNGTDSFKSDSSRKAAVYEFDDKSIAESSVGQGGQAIRNLLTKVGQVKATGKRTSAWRKPTLRQGDQANKPSELIANSEASGRPASEVAREKDDYSVSGSSVGQGHAAIHDLLTQVNQKQPKKRSKKANGDNSLMELTTAVENNDHSEVEGSDGERQATNDHLATEARKERHKRKSCLKNPQPSRRRATQTEFKKNQKDTNKPPLKATIASQIDDQSIVESQSIAESSVGQGQSAIYKLLTQIKKPQSKPQQVSTKRKSTEMDDQSITESSVGQGQAAIQNLLLDVSKTQSGQKRALPTRKRALGTRNNSAVRKPRQPAKKTTQPEIDAQSTTESTIGVDGAAIGNLLAQVNGEPASLGDEEGSVAASAVSGQGRSALASLLAQVGESKELPPKRKRTKKKKFHLIE